MKHILSGTINNPTIHFARYKEKTSKCGIPRDEDIETTSLTGHSNCKLCLHIYSEELEEDLTNWRRIGRRKAYRLKRLLERANSIVTIK